MVPVNAEHTFSRSHDLNLLVCASNSPAGKQGCGVSDTDIKFRTPTPTPSFQNFPTLDSVT